MKSIILIIITGFTILYACDNNEISNPGDKKYFPEVKLIIENHCASCHSSDGTWEGRPTAFDSDEMIAQQYESIKAAVADPVTVTNKRMPKDGTLSAHDIDIIVKWFDKGGKITD